MRGRADAAGFALPIAVAVLLAACLLLSHGSSPSRLFWIALAAIVVAAAATIWSPVRLTGSAFALLACLAGLALWEAVSIEWSIQPARSWDAANRTLVYSAFAALGVLLARTPRTRVAAGIGALFTLTIVVALFGKVVPGI